MFRGTALVAATPLPWSRRVLALLAGALLIDAFTLLQVASVGLVSFGAADAGPQSGGWSRALGATERRVRQGTRSAYAACGRAPARWIPLASAAATDGPWWRRPARP